MAPAFGPVSKRMGTPAPKLVSWHPHHGCISTGRAGNSGHSVPLTFPLPPQLGWTIRQLHVALWGGGQHCRPSTVSGEAFRACTETGRVQQGLHPACMAPLWPTSNGTDGLFLSCPFVAQLQGLRLNPKEGHEWLKRENAAPRPLTPKYCNPKILEMKKYMSCRREISLTSPPGVRPQATGAHRRAGTHLSLKTGTKASVHIAHRVPVYSSGPLRLSGMPPA